MNGVLVPRLAAWLNDQMDVAPRSVIAMTWPTLFWAGIGWITPDVMFLFFEALAGYPWPTHLVKTMQPELAIVFGLAALGVRGLFVISANSRKAVAGSGVFLMVPFTMLFYVVVLCFIFAPLGLIISAPMLGFYSVLTIVRVFVPGLRLALQRAAVERHGNVVYLGGAR
jgi:hypothetical protein